MMNLCDALLCETQARSLAELSLSPFFERQWPSVYEALEDERIDVPRLRQAIVKALMHTRRSHEMLWISFDRSSIARPVSKYQHHSQPNSLTLYKFLS